MIIVGIKYFEISNSHQTEKILANSIEEAENYLRAIKRNGSYKIEDLNILHSYEVATPTKFKTFSRNEDGTPKILDWRDEELRESGRVDLWTELPKSIAVKQKRG